MAGRETLPDRHAMPGRYRYLMNHAVSGEDLESLVSGLEDEREFRLAELVGAGELKQMLDIGLLKFDVESDKRFFNFGGSIAIVSVYLAEYVTGVEVVEVLDFAHKRSRVECWRFIGRQGELVTVPLEYAVALDREIIPGREDLARLRELWRELPGWARNAYKLTFDELADLDAGG